MSLEELLKRPEISFVDLQKLSGIKRDVLAEVAEELEIQIKYAGYLQKQQAHIARMEKICLLYTSQVLLRFSIHKV